MRWLFVCQIHQRNRLLDVKDHTFVYLICHECHHFVLEMSKLSVIYFWTCIWYICLHCLFLNLYENWHFGYIGALTLSIFVVKMLSNSMVFATSWTFFVWTLTVLLLLTEHFFCLNIDSCVRLVQLHCVNFLDQMISDSIVVSLCSCVVSSSLLLLSIVALCSCILCHLCYYCLSKDFFISFVLQAA